jgi:phosphatidylinositol alpha-1,6-mannosyltransferase
MPRRGRPGPPHLVGRFIYVGRMSDGAGHGGSPRARMPRLLVITPDFPPARGGIQVLVHRLVSGLRGFETRILALDSEGAGEFDAGSDLSTRRVSTSRGPSATRNLSLNAFALREAWRFRPDATLSAHIVTSPAAAVIRRVLGARTVQYFYGKEIGNRPGLARFAARQAHAAIAISSYTSGLLAATGIPPEAISLIPPGVDLPRDPRPQQQARPTFLTIARLADRYKGHDVLVQSLALVRRQVPEVQWIVIGDGPLRPELEALARSQGVADAIRFLGAVSDQERDSWLQRADLLAMPSRLPGGGQAGEGFGIVYLEAGAYGKPVVAGNVAGAVDAVIDGVSGLLVDPVDPVAVGEAITRLLLDKELARRLGRAGAERARSLAWPVMVERVKALLLEQLAARPHPGAAGKREPAGHGRAAG